MKKMALVVLLAMGVGTTSFAQEKTVKSTKVSNHNITAKSSSSLSSKVQTKKPIAAKAEVSRYKTVTPSK